MSEQETGFRIGADGRTYYTATGTRTRKTRFGQGLRVLGRFGTKAAKATARGGYKIGRATVRTGSRYAVGLTPGEYAEYFRLRRMEQQGIFSRDETYLYESRRLKELEKRYRATTGRRKAELKMIYKKSGFMQGPPKRLRA